MGVVIIFLALAIAAILCVGGWLWWQVPKWQMRSVTASSPKERADIEDNFRKTIGQGIGGVAAIFAAGFAYLQLTYQQQATQAQLQAQQAQLQNQHDILISNQVSKGFEQLAGDKIEMRLGGIYALEGVMNAPGSPYRVPVLEALCAFVRDHTAIGPPPPAKPLTDVQAVLTVLGRRNPDAATIDIDLRGANIPGAKLATANLNNALLNGANLNNAFLYGAHLSGANLFRADLSDVDLSDAYLIDTYLTGANLKHANLSHTNLSQADLSHANLAIANLTSADLSHTNLAEADLTGANLIGANLGGTNLEGADLTNTNLTFAQNNLTQVQLEKACGRPKALPPGLTLSDSCLPKPLPHQLNFQ